MCYTEEEMLMLSGIQHFVFCPRQWALIHLEQAWADNRLTAEGSLLHSRVDNPELRQMNNNRLTIRSVHIASQELGLYGITDAIELIPSQSSEDAIRHPKHSGWWQLYPIEYKRGHAKSSDCDIMQLVAQVMCLEEMHGINIPEAALFYWETRHREIIAINKELKNKARWIANEMHRVYQEKVIPKAVMRSNCSNCSLYDICMPRVNSCASVKKYLKDNLNEETS